MTYKQGNCKEHPTGKSKVGVGVENKLIIQKWQVGQLDTAKQDTENG